MTLIEILGFVAILCSAVVLHEFGHFIVAKLFKIRVETFSVGFGPRLFGKKWGNTDYRVSAIPLGGYVKLGGDESNAPIEGAGAVDIPEWEMFNLRPRWQRILVAVAGPVMNVLTAMAIPMTIALMFGVPLSPAPIVSYVQQSGAAQGAGLQPGDRIVSFNSIENPKWDSIAEDAALSPEQTLPLVVERNGQRVTLNITPTQQTEDGEVYGSLDFVPDNGGYPVMVSEVGENTPASEAGLQAGDRIVNIDHEQVRSAGHVTEFVHEHKTQPITLTVDRGGNKLDLTAKVRRLSDGTERLGFATRDDYPINRVGVAGATAHAFRTNMEYLRMTGKVMRQVFAGKRSVRNTLSGPIGIYSAASKSIERSGWAGFWGMLTLLSLNLGIFNLLPIPVLDGGAIFLLLLEGMLALIGMTLSTTVRERIQQVGFVVVVLIMVFAVTNDLVKRFSRPPDGPSRPAATAK